MLPLTAFLSFLTILGMLFEKVEQKNKVELFSVAESLMARRNRLLFLCDSR